MARAPDVLKHLQRTDRQTLGGGNRLLWAPPFPLFAARPGLWDEAQYFAFPVKPLFTWTLLDEGGKEIVLRPGARRWDPSALSRTYAGETPHGALAVRETLCLLPTDVVCCTLELKYSGRGKRAVHLAAWTAIERGAGGAPGDSASFHAGTFRFARRAADTGPLTIAAAFTLSPKPHSHAIARTEEVLPPPLWTLTPFAEKFSSGRLPAGDSPALVETAGTLFLALHGEIQLQAGSDAQATVAMAIAPAPAEAEGALHRATGEASPAVASAAHWREHFAGVPRFACSDEQIQRYYWYRWYVLRLNAIRAGGMEYGRPVLCEGPAGRRAPFAPSTPPGILENRWRHDPGTAQAALLGFLDHQRADGSLPASIPAVPAGEETWAYADWGTALLQFDAVHHSIPFLRQVHEGLVRYAKFLDGARDPEGSGLFDILHPGEAGMEYMHRFSALGEDADSPETGLRLKGVDAAVYAYTLKRALAVITRDLGKPGEAELWEIEADKIRNAVRSRMWSPAEEMFFDIDAGTSTQTMVKAVSCFVPYTTDIVSAEHLGGLARHLFNPREFWTPWPVPSTPADDETFRADPEWRGRRIGRPWNGRVWPPANCQVAEAIARSAIAFGDAGLRLKAAEFIRTFIRMMSFEGDPGRPNAFEHYNPATGAPSLYRGIDDCQPASVVDLIIRYVCGIRPTRDALVVDPFPFGLVSASIDDVTIRGRRVKVEIARKKFSVWIDGKAAGSGTIGAPAAFPLP